MKAVADGCLAEAEQEKLTEGWHQILTHQFHDIIPGSSIRDVYEDCRKNYPVMEQIATEVEADFFASCTSTDADCYTVYNASSWTMDEQIVVDEARDGIYRDSNGNVLTSQRVDDKTVVAVKAVPAMGMAVITFEEKASCHVESENERVSCCTEAESERVSCCAEAESERVSCCTEAESERVSCCADAENEKVSCQAESATDTGIETPLYKIFSDGHENETPLYKIFSDGHENETPFYCISINEYGQISRLYDKENEREVLEEGKCANVLQMFEDKPMNYDAWDIDIYYQEKMREVTNLKTYKITECGPLRLVIRLEWDYMNSSFGQDMILYSDDRRIDFVTEAEFAERQQLLKVAFPVDIRATYATYDIQYGNVRRPNHWNTSWDMARFESVGQRFADLSERDYGVSLLNNCKYGYDVKGNVLRLPLLRSALNPDYQQDLGHHEFTYSLLPHKGDFVEGNTVRSAHSPTQPCGKKQKQMRHACMEAADYAFCHMAFCHEPQPELRRQRRAAKRRGVACRLNCYLPHLFFVYSSIIG